MPPSETSFSALSKRILATKGSSCNLCTTERRWISNKYKNIYFQYSFSIQPRTSLEKFFVCLGLERPVLGSFLNLLSAWLPPQQSPPKERCASADLNATFGSHLHVQLAFLFGQMHRSLWHCTFFPVNQFNPRKTTRGDEMITRYW